MEQEVSSNPAVIRAARDVAAAEDALSRCAPVVAAAHAARNPLAERMSALDRQRAEIAARRASGDVRPDDAGEVALVLMDREGVERLLAEAAHAVEAAEREHLDASAQLRRARQALAVAEAEAGAALLGAHVEHVVEVLLAALDAHAGKLAALPHLDRADAARGYVENLTRIEEAMKLGLRHGGEVVGQVRDVRYEPTTDFIAALTRQQLNRGLFVS